MTAWLYQMNQDEWPLSEFAHDVHEKRKSEWQRRRKVGSSPVCPRDKVYFYYAHTVSDRPGFWGVAVIDFFDEKRNCIGFTSIAPTNLLKKHPWWDEGAKEVAKRIRRGSRGTLFEMSDKQEAVILKGITKTLRRA